MFVIGAAITIGNVVIPVIIRRDVPAARVGSVTAAYVATLNVGLAHHVAADRAAGRR